jgi:hypothetical protein
MLDHPQDDVVMIPQFEKQDIEHFGQRAAYQAQLRSPWISTKTRPRPHEDIDRKVAQNREYNAIRGGLPVCATCSSNCGDKVTGHTADSAKFPFHVHVDPMRTRTYTTAELIARQATTESSVFRSELP